MAVNAGTTLGGRYRLREPLGEGGMSVVWRADDAVLGREVAVKILANASVTRRAFRESIRVDARAAASLSHPNVTSVFDFGEFADDEGRRVPYVVMELLRGRVLSDRLQEGPLDPRSALRVCAQVAGALTAAHALGIVHRDIKPGNVMLTAGGAKVFDFGIAASVGQPDDSEPGSPPLGTAAYLAPERLAGASVTAASDVYALALLLFRTLTNTLPWPVQTVTGMIRAHIYIEPGPLPRLDGVPASVRDLAQRCLAKEPLDRPSAREATLVLAAAAGIPPPLGEEEYPQAAAGDPAHAPSPGRRNLRPLVVIGTVVGLLVAAVILPMVGDGGLRPSPAEGATPSITPTATTAAGPAPARTGGPEPRGTPATMAPPTVPTGTPTRPGTTPPTVAPGPTQPTPTSAQRTLDSSGGSVVAECQGTDAYLVSWSPAAGYKALQVNRGPGSSASVVFHLAATKVTMTVTCADGVPTATVTTK